MATYACHPSNQKIEEGEPGIQGQTSLYNKFETSLGLKKKARHFHNNKNKNQANAKKPQRQLQLNKERNPGLGSHLQEVWGTGYVHSCFFMKGFIRTLKDGVKTTFSWNYLTSTL